LPLPPGDVAEELLRRGVEGVALVVGLAAGEHQEPVGRHSGVAIGGEVGAADAQVGGTGFRRRRPRTR